MFEHALKNAKQNENPIIFIYCVGGLGSIAGGIADLKVDVCHDSRRIHFGTINYAV